MSLSLPSAIWVHESDKGRGVSSFPSSQSLALVTTASTSINESVNIRMDSGGHHKPGTKEKGQC